MTLYADKTIYGDLTRWAPDPIGGIFADAGYCGRSFNDGLLRFHNAESGNEAQSLVQDAFGTELPAGAGFFAIDWLGRNYGAIPTPDGDPMVITADIGFGQIEHVAPLDAFIGFLNGSRVEATLGIATYAGWREANSAVALGFTQCLGYKHPPFLGGADSINNLELSNISVYWTILGQAWARTKNLPDGTPITSFTLNN